MTASNLNPLETKEPPEGIDTLFKLARYRAEAHPDQVGFVFLVNGEAEEQRLTYGELDLQARTIAAKIQSLCKPGDHVLLLYGPGLEYIAAFFACHYAGTVPVPAYPPDPMRSERTLSRLQAIVSDCGAKLALGRSEDIGWLGSVQTAELGLAQTLLTEQWHEWSDLPWTAPETNADQIAFLQYTSGSTTTPRGVMVTHRNMWHQFDNMRMGDKGEIVGVSWLPFYHDMGLIGGILTPIGFRRPAYLMSPLAFVQHPMRWLKAISRYRGTTTGAPNFAFDMCVSKFTEADAAGLDLSCLHYIMTGAEPVRSESLERFTETFAPYGLSREVWRPCFGMAETTLGATGIRYGSQLTHSDFSLRFLEQNRAVVVESGSEPSRRLVGCGWALEDCEVIVVDPATCLQLPDDAVGEVWCRGPNVAAGYWNRREETEATFHARLADSGRGPFLRTGDLGFMHNGQLYLTGRSKEVMVFWGRNVYPQDVEMTTWNCDHLLKVNGCAAFAVEAEGHEQLVVVQEVARPKKADLEAIAQNVRQAIQGEHHVHLHALVFIRAGTLPKTSSGKIQRHIAREQFESGHLEVVREWRFPSVLGGSPVPAGEARELPSADEIQRWLVSRIAQVCKVPEEQINPSDSLTQYVMDSVTAFAIGTEMQQWLGRAISPTILYDSPSVRVLAERLADPNAYQADNALLPGLVDQLSKGEVDQALAQLLAGNASDQAVAELSAQLSSPPANGTTEEHANAKNLE